MLFRLTGSQLTLFICLFKVMFMILIARPYGTAATKVVVEEVRLPSAIKAICHSRRLLKSPARKLGITAIYLGINRVKGTGVRYERGGARDIR